MEHRRLPLSLLLNDNVEGAPSVPKSGPHLYHPWAGGAVVFSCSSLHEATDATDVTARRRGRVCVSRLAPGAQVAEGFEPGDDAGLGIFPDESVPN